MQYTVYLNTMKHEKRLPMRLDQGRPCCYEEVLCQSPGPPGGLSYAQSFLSVFWN